MRANLRQAFRTRYVPLFVCLSVDTLVLAGAACAIVFAVWRQDPGR